MQLKQKSARSSATTRCVVVPHPITIAVQRFGVAFPCGNLIINLSGRFILLHARTVFLP